MEENNLERRVRALEQQMAANEAWRRESAKNMEETFRRLDHGTIEVKQRLASLDEKVDTLKSVMDKTTTKVAMVILSASVLVSAIFGAIYYATRTGGG